MIHLGMILAFGVLHGIFERMSVGTYIHLQTREQAPPVKASNGHSSNPSITID